MNSLPESPPLIRRGKALKVSLLLLLFVASIGFLLVRTGVISLGETPADWPVPSPDLSAVEERVRTHVEAARRAVVDDPTSADGWGEYALALDAHLLVTEASEAYARACQLDPEKFRWVYLHAITRYLLTDPPETVIALLDAALALKPDYAHGHVRLGDVLVIAGQSEEARARYLRAIELDADLAVARRSLGQLLLTLNETEDAIHHLNQAEALAPGDRSVATSLSQGYLRLGDRERATEFASRAPDLDQRIGLIDPLRREVEDLGLSTRLCDERAGRRIYEKRFEEAIPDLLIVLEKYPDDAMVHYRLGMCYEETGQVNQAVVHLTTALRQKEDLVEAHFRMAKIFWGQDFARVEHHYRAMIEHGEPNADWHTTLAIAMAQQGKIEEALPDFERAVELAPDRIDKHSDLAVGLLQLQRFEEAADRCETALELEPGHPRVNFILGQACEKLDRIDDAIAAFRRAAEADPASPAASRLMELTARRRQSDG